MIKIFPELLQRLYIFMYKNQYSRRYKCSPLVSSQTKPCPHPKISIYTFAWHRHMFLFIELVWYNLVQQLSTFPSSSSERVWRKKTDKETSLGKNCDIFFYLCSIFKSNSSTLGTFLRHEWGTAAIVSFKGGQHWQDFEVGRHTKGNLLSILNTLHLLLSIQQSKILSTAFFF